MIRITNNFYNNNRKAEHEYRRYRLNHIYNLLVSGFDYNDIIIRCPELTEDELNNELWYMARRGLRYIPTLN